VTLHGEVHALQDGGDHTILVGKVDDVMLNDTDPALYYQRAFHEVKAKA